MESTNPPANFPAAPASQTDQKTFVNDTPGDGQSTPPTTPPATPPVTTPTATPPATPPAQTTPPVTPPATPDQPAPLVDTIPATVPPPTITSPQTTPQTPPTQEQLDEMKAEAEKLGTEKASKSFIQKLTEAFGLSKKEEEEVPTDPTKMKEYISNVAKKQAEETLKVRDEKAAETTKEQDDKLQEGAKNFQQTWTYQYEQMAINGGVPKIEKPQDPQDPGNIAKGRILLKLNEVLEENKKNGIDYVPSLWEILSRYPNVFKTAGANVPVAGRGRTTGGETRMPYAKLHNTPIETMVADQAPQS